MNETRQFRVNDLVSFRSPDGDVMGRIVKTEGKVDKDVHRVTVLVTSRKFKYYPKGLRYSFLPSALVLRRAAAEV